MWCITIVVKIANYLGTITAVIVFIAFEVLAGISISSIVEKGFKAILLLAPPLMALRGNIFVPYLFREYTFLNIYGRKRFVRYTLLNTISALITGVLVSALISLITTLICAELRLLLIGVTTTLISLILGILVLTPLVIALTYIPFLDAEDFIPTIGSGFMDYLTPLTIVIAVDVISKPLLISTMFLALALGGFMILSRDSRSRRVFFKQIVENGAASLSSLLSFVSGAILYLNSTVLIAHDCISIYPLTNAILGVIAGVFYGSITVSLHIYGTAKHEQLVRGLIKTVITIAISTLFIVGLAPKTITIFFLTVLMGGLMLVMISYVVAKVSFRMGLDPDNIVFPITTGLGDILGALLLSLFSYVFTA